MTSSALHVLVDALSSYSGGARTYMRAVLPRLAARPGVRVTVTCREDQREGFGLHKAIDGLRWERVPDAVRPLAARLAWSASAVPALAARVGADVLFCPTDHSPPVSPCPVVLMIRNPTPYVKGMQTEQSPLRRVREAGMRAVTLGSAWRSQRIVLVSHAALDATAAVIPLPMERVRVVHHGRDDRFCPPPPGSTREPGTLLSVSSIYAFKNYPVLLDAMRLLRDVHGLTPRLDICGAPFDRAHAEELARQVEQLGLAAHVRLLGEVAHADLVGMYQRAEVFVMPSRLETFGHPYIEAMATGTPAVVGDIPCAREMCGDAARYAHPDRADEFARALAELLRDGRARAALAEAGPRRAAAFSWDRTVTETEQVLREAVAVARGDNAPLAA